MCASEDRGWSNRFEIILPKHEFTAIDPLWDAGVHRFQASVKERRRHYFYEQEHLLGPPKRYPFRRGELIFVKSTVFLKWGHPAEQLEGLDQVRSLVRRLSLDSAFKEPRSIGGVFREFYRIPGGQVFFVNAVRLANVPGIMAAYDEQGNIFLAALTQEHPIASRADTLARTIHFFYLASLLILNAFCISSFVSSFVFPLGEPGGWARLLGGLLWCGPFLFVLLYALMYHLKTWMVRAQGRGSNDYDALLRAERRLAAFKAMALKRGWVEAERDPSAVLTAQSPTGTGGGLEAVRGYQYLDEVDPTWTPLENWCASLPYPHPLHRLYRAMQKDGYYPVIVDLRTWSFTVDSQIGAAAMEERIRCADHVVDSGVVSVECRGATRWFVPLSTFDETTSAGPCAVVSLDCQGRCFVAAMVLTEDPARVKYLRVGFALPAFFLVVFVLLLLAAYRGQNPGALSEVFVATLWLLVWGTLALFASFVVWLVGKARLVGRDEKGDLQAAIEFCTSLRNDEQDARSFRGKGTVPRESAYLEHEIRE